MTDEPNTEDVTHDDDDLDPGELANRVRSSRLFAPLPTTDDEDDPAALAARVARL